MKERSVSLKSRLLCIVGSIALTLACMIGIPSIAHASSSYVSLFDLQNIAPATYKGPGYVSEDNYGNTYTRSVVFGGDSKFEYLLNEKYSRFTGTIFIKNGETSTNEGRLTITGDGQLLYTTPTLTKISKPIQFDINVSGYNDLFIHYEAPVSATSLFCGIGDAGFYTVDTPDNPGGTPGGNTGDNPGSVPGNPVNPSGDNIYRMYNPQSGEHLYTTDSYEANTLMTFGWRLEQTSSVPKSGTSVYRLYNPFSGEHLYTTSRNEYDSLGYYGWRGEGEKFHSADASSGVPAYRLYNRWGSGVTAHTYTTSDNERNTLVSKGWREDGICWYEL